MLLSPGIRALIEANKKIPPKQQPPKTKGEPAYTLTDAGFGLLPRAGGPGGFAGDFIQCPDNKLVMGMKLKRGQYVDRINSIYCRDIREIQESTPFKEILVAPGGGGLQETYQCPPGQALKGWKVKSGAWMDSIQLECQPITKPTSPSTWSNIFGGGGGAPHVRSCPPGQYVDTVKTRMGQFVDSIEGKCKDISAFQRTLASKEEQLKCCAGESSDPIQCAYPWTPGSDACSKLKSEVCSNVKAKEGSQLHFFSPYCKKLIARGDRQQVISQADDEMAWNVCSSIKNNLNATEEQRVWCACYNAEVPPDVPLAARGIFQCLNPDCTSRGLKPITYTCPSVQVLCEQTKIKTELRDSTIGKQFLQQQCGSVIIGDTTGKGEDPLIPGVRNKTLVLGGIIGGVLILLSILFLLAKVVLTRVK